ncbi:MAG: shikimate dehydrogenase [Flavobacteriales bacterium]|nr:shikimate dehydrogenase [Flavobacteriales bacterium]
MSRYGLIGKPLSHSFSQAYFTAKFKRERLIGHRYDPYPLAAVTDLHDLVRDTPGLRGLNVTIPYKQSVMPLLDAVDPLAASVGAVNTIKIEDGRLIGFNTDVEGFRRTLHPLLKGSKPRALVLGSGGASRAVAFVLREAGIRFRVVSRSRERGDLTYDLLEPIIAQVSTLIINTTPLGMHPEEDTFPPIPYEAIGPKHILIDLVYNPEITRFLAAGKACGATTVNGRAMLEAQAEASWAIWNSEG